MIGLSAQDANIQQLFVHAAVQQVWPWNDEPPPHVFAEDQLQDDQKTLPIRFKPINKSIIYDHAFYVLRADGVRTAIGRSCPALSP